MDTRCELAEALEIFATDWVRFDEYRIVDGYIRPVTRATGDRFDPWAYREAMIARAPTDTPYLSLLNAVGAEDVVPDQQAILRWCSRFGLLGLLLQKAHWTVFPPRLESPSGKIVSGDHAAATTWAQEEYFLTPKGWDRHRRVCPLLTDKPHLGTIHLGGLKGRATMGITIGPAVSTTRPPSKWPGSGVLVQDIETGQYKDEPIGTIWGKYFPDVPQSEKETAVYPFPRLKNFWIEYGEPFNEFVAAARALGRAVAHLQSPKARPRSHGPDLLNALVAPVSLSLEVGGSGNYLQRWKSPSLLASLAMMVLQDVTGSRRILKCLCTGCPRLFSSTSPNAKFHDKRCRARHLKRAQRRRRQS